MRDWPHTHCLAVLRLREHGELYRHSRVGAMRHRVTCAHSGSSLALNLRLHERTQHAASTVVATPATNLCGLASVQNVARDLIPQIACSNSYVLRLRNQRNWCSASCTAHRSANPPPMTTPSPDGTLTSRQSASQARQLPEHLSYGVLPLAAFVVAASRVTSPKSKRSTTALPYFRLAMNRQLLLAAHSHTTAVEPPG